MTLSDAQLLATCLDQPARSEAEARASFAVALRRVRLERAALRLEQPPNRG